MPSDSLIPIESLIEKIVIIKNQKEMLDNDLLIIYCSICSILYYFSLPSCKTSDGDWG